MDTAMIDGLAHKLPWSVLTPYHFSERSANMNNTTVYRNVHGAEEFYVVVEDEPRIEGESKRKHSNVPVLASTVQKTKHWISEVMVELQWEDAQKTYHGMRAVLHTLRDRLTIHETADFAAQLPMLIRGMFYECWQPDQVPVKDRTKEAFLVHVGKAFAGDQSVDPEILIRAVLRVVARHVSEGEMEDIEAIVPKSLRGLFSRS
jgi:uncharacterized protein (DUF2267 family)